jgi:hypothetical protein
MGDKTKATMTARDDYPEPDGMHPAQYDQMCNEIDMLRGKVGRIRNDGWTDADRWRAHSEVLNTVGYRLAVARGRNITDGVTSGSPLADVDALIAKATRFDGLQERCAAWRKSKYPESTEFGVFTKLVEEVGEVARAMIGLAEKREGRGEVHLEAAQVVLVLLSLLGWFYPGHDLLADVIAELERQGG